MVPIVANFSAPISVTKWPSSSTCDTAAPTPVDYERYCDGKRMYQVEPNGFNAVIKFYGFVDAAACTAAVTGTTVRFISLLTGLSQVKSG